MTPRTVEDFAARLEAFGRIIERLDPPCRRDPDKFHEQKSELRRQMRALAVEFRNGFGGPQNRPFPNSAKTSEKPISIEQVWPVKHSKIR